MSTARPTIVGSSRSAYRLPTAIRAHTIMRPIVRGVLVAVALCIAVPAAAQLTLGFEELPVAQPVSPLQPPMFTEPRPYGGFEFAGFFVGDATAPGAGAGAAGGARFAYVGNGIGSGEIYSPAVGFTGFGDFLGVRATGPLAGPASVTVRGFDVGGNEVFTQALALTTTPTYFAFGTPLIDALEFDTSTLDADAGAGAVLVLDDVVISTVPEPATVALLATGLVAIGGVAHRRRGRPAAPDA